jgi:hypothetical protein
MTWAYHPLASRWLAGHPWHCIRKRPAGMGVLPNRIDILTTISGAPEMSRRDSAVYVAGHP